MPSMTRAELAAAGFKLDGHKAVRVEKPIASSNRPEAETLEAIVPRYRSKLEAAYAGQLHVERSAGAIRQWDYEPFALLLAKGLRYRIDWLVWTREGAIEIHETKGQRVTAQHQRGMAKLRIAAKLYPMFRFFKVTYHDGRFTRQRISA